MVAAGRDASDSHCLVRGVALTHADALHGNHDDRYAVGAAAPLRCSPPEGPRRAVVSFPGGAMIPDAGAVSGLELRRQQNKQNPTP